MPEFLVPDMTCDGCVRAIQTAVKAADPGSTVLADLASKRVRVTSVVSDEIIAMALRDAGFAPAFT